MLATCSTVALVGTGAPMFARSTKALGDTQLSLHYTPGIVGGSNATDGEEETITSTTLDNADASELHAIIRSEILCDLASLEG